MSENHVYVFCISIIQSCLDDNMSEDKTSDAGKSDKDEQEYCADSNESRYTG